MPVQRFLPFLSLAAIAVAACSERQSDSPVGPRGAEFAAAPTSTCDLKALSKDVNATWPSSSPTGKTVSSLVTTMQQNASDSNVLTLKGFEILDTLAHSAAQRLIVSDTVGSKLAFDLLLCMDVGPRSSTLSSTSFIGALDTTGAFAVRGVGGSVTGDPRPVVVHDSGWAIAPTGAASWQGVTLRSGTAGSTVLRDTTKKLFLAFALPGTSTGFTGTGDSLLNAGTNPNNTVINWSTQPSQTFSPTPLAPPGPLDPGVLVSQCPTGAGTYQPGFVQHNPADSASAEILAFASVTCPFPPTYTGGDGKGYYARRQQKSHSLMDGVHQFFAPVLAYALGTLGGSGTKATGLSPWGVIFPGKVNLTNPTWPSKSGNTINIAFSPTVTAVARSNGGVPFKQPTVFAWLEAANNQGVNVLVCNNWAFTEPDGTLEFKKAFLNKAGGYTLTMKTVGTNVPNSAFGTPLVPAGPPISSPLLNAKNASTTSGTGCTGVNVYINGVSTIPAPPSGPPSDGNPYWATGTLTQ